MKTKNTLRTSISSIKKNYVLYLMILPAVVYVIIFHYVPMSGVQIAFKNYRASLGIWGSPFNGLANFQSFFRSPSCWTIISNTLLLSAYDLLVNFPLSIIIALLINQCRFLRYKRFVQNILYAPYFVSVVVLVGMMEIMFSPSSGIVNTIIKACGGTPIFFVGTEGVFRHLYVWSDVWQNLGFNSIIFVAALAGVNPELHEAAIMDGASKLRRIWSIDLVTISPTIMIILILAVGKIMNVGFEKVYLMQNNINAYESEIISTYIYKKGIQDVNYGVAAAVGLFNNIINCILLLSVNKLSKSMTSNSLW